MIVGFSFQLNWSNQHYTNILTASASASTLVRFPNPLALGKASEVGNLTRFKVILQVDDGDGRLNYKEFEKMVQIAQKSHKNIED